MSLGCPICLEYFQKASLAIRRHLRAISALELAVRETRILRYDALTNAVNEASFARENAVASYGAHVAIHFAST